MSEDAPGLKSSDLVIEAQTKPWRCVLQFLHGRPEDLHHRNSATQLEVLSCQPFNALVHGVLWRSSVSSSQDTHFPCTMLFDPCYTRLPRLSDTLGYNIGSLEDAAAFIEACRKN